MKMKMALSEEKAHGGTAVGNGDWRIAGPSEFASLSVFRCGMRKPEGNFQTEVWKEINADRGCPE